MKQSSVGWKYSTVTVEDYCCRVVAARKDGATRTIILLPGWKGTHLALKSLGESLFIEGSSVIIVDYPVRTHKGADLAPNEDLAEAGLVHKVCERLLAQEDSAVLLGHSAGGIVSLSIASNRPAWLRGLILVSPVLWGITASWHQRLLQRVVVAYANALQNAPLWFAQNLLLSPFIGDISNLLLAKRGLRGYMQIASKSWAERAHPFNAREVGKHLANLMSSSTVELAARVTVPVRIVAGSRDDGSNSVSRQALRAGIEDYMEWILTGAGHLAHHEDSQAVETAVLEAIRSIG